MCANPGARLSVPIELVQHYIARRAPWFRGRPVENDDHAIHVSFQPALAQSFGRGRAWLAGEAAHVTSPIGGQSLNAGVREVHELASSITSTLRSNAGPRLFHRYEREVHREWSQLLGLVGEPATHRASDAWVVANARRLVPCIPATGEHLGALAAQVGIDLPVT